ncbi:MAG: hypothetical protein ACREAA_08835 [Candidatus Polarisedimenticolia bacterium]
MRRRAAVLALLMILASSPAGAGDPAPMTNEDIVRMTMNEWSAERIVEAIRAARATAFDLDPEVIAELREARVAEAVIQAMKEATPEAPGPDIPAGPSPPGQVTLQLRAPRKPGAPEGQAPMIEVPARDPNGRAIQGALLLVCTDPRHVPDGWIGSPFGADLGRNHLLWHSSGTRPKEDDNSGVLLMSLPTSVDVPVEAGEHPIALMLALRIGDEPWGTLAFSEGRLTVAEAAPVVITAEVSGRLTGRRTRTSGFTCRLTGSEPAGALSLTAEKEGAPAP